MPKIVSVEIPDDVFQRIEALKYNKRSDFLKEAIGNQLVIVERRDKQKSITPVITVKAEENKAITTEDDEFRKHFLDRHIPKANPYLVPDED